MAGVSPAPAAMGVGEIDLYPMYSLSLVFPFSLQNELLQDGVITSDNAVGVRQLEA